MELPLLLSQTRLIDVVAESDRVIVRATFSIPPQGMENPPPRLAMDVSELEAVDGPRPCTVDCAWYIAHQRAMASLLR